jgi:5-methylcytosine-specific restriction protein A
MGTFQASFGVPVTTRNSIALRPLQATTCRGFSLPIRMLKAAPKPCNQPGCGVLVRDGTSRCPKHPKANSFADKRRGNRHERGYGSAWDKLRALILARDEGLCQPCVRAHRVSLATAVDHTVPKAEGGTDDPSNLQAICRACHLDKTAAEAKRGIDRGWGASKV